MSAGGSPTSPEPGPGRACLTLATNDHIAGARVIAESYLRHHPGDTFYVCLVDEPDDALDLSAEPFEVLSLDQIGLPWPEYFPYQYSVLELISAVKPFAMAHLFETTAVDIVVYLDADIRVYRPFTELWQALEASAIVLTPHLRVPYPDSLVPNELEIIVSGQFNLGFIALRRSASTSHFLEWWQEKAELRSVEDPERGLFYDQRWMDLVPSYYDDAASLRDPSYNVAYWNLHERTVEHNAHGFTVSGRPLTFFHFSGYLPTRRSVLANYQSRHTFEDLPGVRTLFDGYADDLLAAGYRETMDLPYAFGRLPNGVPVTNLFNDVIRNCLERGIPIPSPVHAADALCAFLMRPNYAYSGRRIPPLVAALERRRPDVVKAYPEAFIGRSLTGLRWWFEHSGARELGVERLIERYGAEMERQDPVEHLAEVLERRSDLLSEFPRPYGRWSDARALADWMSRFGVDEEGFEAGDGEAFLAARSGVVKALALYVRRHDVQGSLPSIISRPGLDAFVNWLLSYATREGVTTASEVFFFREFAKSEPQQLARQLLAYGGVSEVHSRMPATVFDDRGKAAVQVGVDARDAGSYRALLVAEGYLTPLAQLEVLYANSATHRAMFPDAFRNQAATLELARYAGRTLTESSDEVDAPLDAWHERLLKDAGRYQVESDGVNVVGYHDAPTGMGRSVRSLAHALSAADYEVTDVRLPAPYVANEATQKDLSEGLLFGWHTPAAETSIIVANADEFPSIRAFMPGSFWRDSRHIGYWTWETQRLPARFGDVLGLAEVWVPSNYVADAMRTVIDLPINVVPHALDTVMLARAASDRVRFGIPEDVTVFGYVFDCKSVVERKNPAALVAAFRQAFGTSTDEAVLVLKVSSPGFAPREMSRLRDEIADLNVIWIDSSMDYASLLNLMASLDVYVSLHRSEGFGLTLAEAMGLGRPVIASAYSGNLDFMTEQSALLVAVGEVETERDHGPYRAGTRWADPDIDAAAAAMRQCLDPDLRASWGTAGREHVLSLLSPEAVGQRARKVLQRAAD